jgi:hypothetical protein
VWLACKSESMRPLRERFRQIWTAGSDGERLVTLATVLWPVYVPLLLRFGLIPVGIFRSLSPRYVLPVCLALVLSCRLSLLLAEALATTRRS